MCHQHYKRVHYNRKVDLNRPLEYLKSREYLIVRFINKIEKTDSCWLWIGAKNKVGYGYFQDKLTRNKYAHRFSYNHFKGFIADGLFVLHNCDNPSCVNPDHLFLGTHDDNMKDAVRKNRFPKGDNHYMRKRKITNVLH